jgi:VanZ family protein
MLNLRLRTRWILGSCALVLIVVWGSLQSAFGGPAVHGFDKFEHFSTYMFLAVWFTGLFERRRWWLIATGLLGLGLAMEVGQYLMQSGRLADANDMLANTAGVVAGLLLAALVTGGWAQKVEAWLE